MWRSVPNACSLQPMPEDRNITPALSVQDYLDGEQRSDVRREYIAGHRAGD